MSYVVHRSENRGKSDLGWLKSRFSFSFADYYNPKRTGFGKLLVLNDDLILPSKGFGAHPHENMEIITLVKSGQLLHKDNIGNTEVINEGEMQVMSAGRGIVHSEYNNSKKESLELFQIWIQTARPEITPRHDKRKIEFIKNQFFNVVSGDKKDKLLFINQDAKIMLGKFDIEKKINLEVKSGRGLFIFLIEGNADINGQNLFGRDSIEINQNSEVEIITKDGLFVLIIDVPL